MELIFIRTLNLKQRSSFRECTQMICIIALNLLYCLSYALFRMLLDAFSNSLVHLRYSRLFPLPSAGVNSLAQPLTQDEAEVSIFIFYLFLFICVYMLACNYNYTFDR